MIPSPVIVFAVHYPCLLLVQFQTITLEPLFQPSPQVFRLFLGDAVRYPIISISCPRYRRKFLYHEIIERIVQEQVRQYWAYHPAL